MALMHSYILHVISPDETVGLSSLSPMNFYELIVAGVAFQNLSGAENIGYIISVPVIKHLYLV